MMFMVLSTLGNNKPNYPLPPPPHYIHPCQVFNYGDSNSNQCSNPSIPTVSITTYPPPHELDKLKFPLVITPVTFGRAYEVGMELIGKARDQDQHQFYQNALTLYTRGLDYLLRVSQGIMTVIAIAIAIAIAITIAIERVTK
jgi:hypothetical protein